MYLLERNVCRLYNWPLFWILCFMCFKGYNHVMHLCSQCWQQFRQQWWPKFWNIIPKFCFHHTVLMERGEKKKTFTDLKFDKKLLSDFFPHTKWPQHEASFLRERHWLPVKHPIDFQIAVMVYKAGQFGHCVFIWSTFSAWAPCFFEMVGSKSSGHSQIHSQVKTRRLSLSCFLSQFCHVFRGQDLPSAVYWSYQKQLCYGLESCGGKQTSHEWQLRNPILPGLIWN